jgi:hypothetical protein
MDREQARTALLLDLFWLHEQLDEIDNDELKQKVWSYQVDVQNDRDLGFRVAMAEVYRLHFKAEPSRAKRMMLSRAFDQLEDDGLIEVYRSSANGRALRAKLTADGRKAAVELD